MDAKKKRWLGGEVRWGKRGPSFLVDRWVGGRHFHFSTKCRTERAALKELEKFEADPHGYRATRTRRAAGLAMTPELIDQYLDWIRAKSFDAKYIDEHERYLGQLMVALQGRDLRHVGLSGVTELLEAFGAAALRNRAKALKAFCAWLRQRGVLTRTDDPTLDLRNPSPPAEKTKRVKAMTLETVQRALPLMRADIADVVLVLAHTGMHKTELERIHQGKGGLYERADWQQPDVVGNLSVDRHKSGQKHVVAITDQEVLDAARRMLARRRFPAETSINYSDRKVSAILGERFASGSLRHSISTWLAKRRVSVEDIAAQLGHTTTKQARATYIDLGAAAHSNPVPKLTLVKG